MTKSKKGIHPVIVSDGTFDSTALALLSLDEVLFSTGITPPAEVIAVAIGVEPEAIEECEDEDDLLLLCVHEMMDQWMNDKAGEVDMREYAIEMVDRLKAKLEKLKDEED